MIHLGLSEIWLKNNRIIEKDNGIYNKYLMDLQLFADDSDKTEKATPKRKQEARKKGQILHSPEVNTAVVLTVAFLGLKLFGKFIFENILAFTEKMFTVYIQSNNIFESATLYAFLIEVAIVLVKVTAPIMGTVLLGGLVVNYAQVGFLFTTETIKFNIERIINPVNGLKRMFSMRTVAELVKSFVKIIIVSVVLYQFIKDESDTVLYIMNLSMDGIISHIGTLVFNIAIRICIILCILSLFDYVFQWWQYEKQLRMSKQEMKDEYKETEGNPQIKSKIREQQRAMSMRRMMQDVPQADVVITNPTHYAVAIQYDTAKSPSPIVIAKGQDYIAQRIKDIAKENSVEIVENKPLARSLYSSVEVGESIPQELYQAVAEVLAFVYSLRDKK